MHVQVSIQIQLPLLYFLDGCMYKWVSTWCRFSYRCCTSLTGACTSEYPDSVTAAVLPWRVHVQVSFHMMQIHLPLLYFLDGCMYKWVSMMRIQLPLLYFLDGCMYKWVSRFSYHCCTSLTGACTSEYPLLYFLDGCMYKWVSMMQIQLPLLYFLDGCMYKWVSTAVLPRRVHVQVSIHMMQIQLPLLYFLDGCMYKWVSMMQIQLPLLYFRDGCMYKWVSRFSYRCCTSLTGACTSEYPDSVTAAVLPWRVHVQVSIHMMQIQLPLLYFRDGCMYKWVSRFSNRCCTSLTGACTSEYPWCRFSYHCCTS